MKNRNTIIILIYLFAFLFILSGCSSGGDSGGGDGNPSTKSDTKISGAAVKGIIKDGLVEIFPITNGQIASQPIATTTTANDGSYSFTLDPNFSGPVLIVVRDNASGTATMKCDNFSGCAGNYNFGDDMPLEEMELKSIIANVSGGAQTGAVTPYTHMAAAYAEQLAATGGYDAAKIAQANSQVGNLLGINNIVTTVPPDVSQLDPANTDVNAIITIAYGPRRIEGTVAVVNGEPTGNITITNQDGVVITLRRDNAANIGEITYNGTKYADIEEVNGIMLIRYSDGYFESI